MTTGSDNLGRRSLGKLLFDYYFVFTMDHIHFPKMPEDEDNSAVGSE